MIWTEFCKHAAQIRIEILGYKVVDEFGKNSVSEILDRVIWRQCRWLYKEFWPTKTVISRKLESNGI